MHKHLGSWLPTEASYYDDKVHDDDALKYQIKFTSQFMWR